jgi:hypothetical protein
VDECIGRKSAHISELQHGGRVKGRKRDQEVCTDIIYLWEEYIQRTEELHMHEIDRKRRT